MEVNTKHNSHIKDRFYDLCPDKWVMAELKQSNLSNLIAEANMVHHGD